MTGKENQETETAISVYKRLLEALRMRGATEATVKYESGKLVILSVKKKRIE